jgi:hypothetical protein
MSDEAGTRIAREGDVIQGGPWDGYEVIHVYTREQAIEDGTLVDLTPWAKETGFKVPVACTSAVWDLIEANEAERERAFQDTRGRAHDVLWMAYLAARRAAGGHTTELRFPVVFQVRGRPEFGLRKRKVLVGLKLHSGAGDAGEHVMTIMLPHED